MKFVETVARTVQGEGKYVGAVMSLLRFSGCNHKCDFCDTDYSEDKVEFDSYVQLLDALPMRKIIVTGGEPTIHPMFKEVVRTLLLSGKEIHVETNGYKLGDWAAELPGNITWAVSPKFRSSGNRYKFMDYMGIQGLYHEIGGLIRDCFLKYVISKDFDADLNEAIALTKELGASFKNVWFQPVDNDKDIYRRLVEKGPVMAHYGIQIHKLGGVK